MGVAGVGSSELGESDKEEFRKTQEQLLKLRRQSVGFVPLQAGGGASGPQYTQAQLSKTWESMRLGHQFTRKKGDRRALIFSADLFPLTSRNMGEVGALQISSRWTRIA